MPLFYTIIAENIHKYDNLSVKNYNEYIHTYKILCSVVFYTQNIKKNQGQTVLSCSTLTENLPLPLKLAIKISTYSKINEIFLSSSIL